MTAAATGETGNVTEADLVACLPHLRAFARFLTGNRQRADDLVQDTIVRALAAAHEVQPGTNLKAWMFTILRNLRYGKLYKNRVRLQSSDGAAAHELAMVPSPEADLEFSDFRRAFWRLGENQREVLILVGATGLSYEEVAKVCDCTTGTIRNRASRAHRELLRMLQTDKLADKRRDTPALASDIGPLGSMREGLAASETD